MSKIIAIGTGVPPHAHTQDEVLGFMQRIHASSAEEARKMKFLYRHSGIDTRYSVVPDYHLPAAEWTFYSPSENLEPFPSTEKRMQWYGRHAPVLAVQAIRSCLEGLEDPGALTHLITVSCTGMSAPGLDLQIMEAMQLPTSIFRSSVNFMGCYAAIHGLKWADAICRSDPDAKVMVVCVELCTLHFQSEATKDNISSAMLFADGAAAVLVTPDTDPRGGFRLEQFHSEVSLQGKSDMAWDITSSGFQMTLSSYIPDLVEADFASLVDRALKKAGLGVPDIRHWCIHPGGKRILEAIGQSLHLADGELDPSYAVMRAYGNMSSPTLLFVLQRIQEGLRGGNAGGGNAGGGNAGGGAGHAISGGAGPAVEYVFAAAFGPGLTMETFIASVV
ncbi:type III polyketide synthase [Dinghuibacter silviterrae]|uniref:Putative naringenin-chalcone synthase n=1 Tax=Dinghuibacter silviterrae TaxID=1539049 RepID=A0A4R8DS79_9BACT|nr:type III polyketide synthase [Dinghuibacter silviterrae]TDX00227.1 putative naringenin-chalcone synthase [Dinghuibacter silviterrae]